MTVGAQVTFEEFWALRNKGGHKRRQRDIKLTIHKAENILNAGAMLTSACLRHELASSRALCHPSRERTPLEGVTPLMEPS